MARNEIPEVSRQCQTQMELLSAIVSNFDGDGAILVSSVIIPKNSWLGKQNLHLEKSIDRCAADNFLGTSSEAVTCSFHVRFEMKVPSS